MLDCVQKYAFFNGDFPPQHLTFDPSINVNDTFCQLFFCHQQQCYDSP